MTKKSDSKRQPRRSVTSTAELVELKAWLQNLDLGVTPTVHVNGHHYPMALVSVDFGSPLKQVRLTSDQSSELSARLRRVAREIVSREANIRVSADNSNGIHWASVA